MFSEIIWAHTGIHICICTHFVQQSPVKALRNAHWKLLY